VRARAPALALALALAGCGRDAARPAAVRDAAVVVHAPAPPDAAPEAGYIGVITAAESVDVAPRFEGVVAAVDVRPGDHVTAGQVVAEMDQKSMEEELRAAQAALGAAVAAHRQAAVDVEDARRKLALETQGAASGVSPRSAVAEAKLAVKRAEAAAARAGSTVAAERSHVQTAKDHLSDTALRAHADGTVAMRFKDPGATVAAGAPILRIVGQGAMRLRFAVPPDRAGALQVGGDVTATVETVAKPLQAEIRQISPALDPASGLVLVEAELVVDPDTAKQLRPGLAATVAP
jgi:RND family efflux transporter MFP subunit